MSDSDTFLRRVIAARRAAWLVLLIGVGVQGFAYLGYLALDAGELDGWIESGIYGDISRGELGRLSLFYISAVKLINHAILLGALFLTLWVRGLRRIGERVLS